MADKLASAVAENTQETTFKTMHTFTEIHITKNTYSTFPKYH